MRFRCQYVGQSWHKISTRWNAHRSSWNSFDATADHFKAALLNHFYKHHDLTGKPHILQYFKVNFVKQLKVTYLDKFESEWFYKTDAKINKKIMILPHISNFGLQLLRSESPSGMRAKLRTVAASNNRVHMPWSLYYCLFAPTISGVVHRAHPVRGESHIQRNANGEVATQVPSYLVVAFYPMRSSWYVISCSALWCSYSISICWKAVPYFTFPGSETVLHFIAGVSLALCSVQRVLRSQHFSW